jgi:HPt (histidine-containing phosphotransfer) domain-containing protein
MDEYMSKPFKNEDIDAVISRLVSAQKFGPKTGDASFDPAVSEFGPETVAAAEDTAPEETDASYDLEYVDTDASVGEESPPIDIAATIEAFMGDVSIAERVIKEFAARLPDQIGQVATYLENGSAADARIVAHAIKGGAWNLNSAALGDAAKQIEDACRDEDIALAKDGIDAVSQRANEFSAFVEQFDFSVYR